MTNHNPLDASNNLVDQAAASADRAILSTQRVANEALDSLSGSVQHARREAGPMLDRTSDQIGALAQRGVNAVRDTSQQLHDKALRASDSAIGYVKHEPVKAMLIAAATGAALMALISLMARSRRP